MSSTYKLTIENRVVKTTVIAADAQLHQALKAFLTAITTTTTATTSLKRVVGLDIEKCAAGSHPTKVFEKVAILKLCSGTTCLIIQLHHLKSAPLSLSKFLQLQELSFVGVGIRHCLEALERDYGLKCRNAVDLGEMAARVKELEMYRGYGLVDLAERLCLLDGKKMMSSCDAVAFTNWAAQSLSQQQVEAATRAAFLCFYVGNHLLGGLPPSTGSDRQSRGYDYDYDCY